MGPTPSSFFIILVDLSKRLISMALDITMISLVYVCMIKKKYIYTYLLNIHPRL